MRVKKAKSRVISVVLVIAMLIGILPNSIFASEEVVSTSTETTSDTLTAALAEAKSYIDNLTINNSSNDPSTVVSNFKTHFTWDNEKRESSKKYLFDWSYYNGVVFEGLEYVYEVTKEDVYKNYVIEYMSSLIASNGTWAKCSNKGYTSKECAGYNSTHGADCYKTASLLLDAYEMTGDSRYLTMAATLYADLDTAAEKYSLPNAGNNYHHTWASASSPNLWLDGLYMILPFRAEYAKHIGDTEELDLIVSRLQWVSDNMYNSQKGLFYHAANSATSNSGTYWLRSMGWYAAALVDVMDSMEGENLETMKAQLVKLVDGMKAVQNSTNGMWLNNMAASQSSTNPYETSGTALVCYAVMKAVNNGWLDVSYADMAILAFKGICNEKLNGEDLTDICFKGAPGSSNSTFYDNEGKGVGPFIMLYAEVMEYTQKQEEEPEEPTTQAPEEPEEPTTQAPEEPEEPTTEAPEETEEPTTEVPEETEEPTTEAPKPTTETVTVSDATISVSNIIGLTASTVAKEDQTLIEAKKYASFIAYDLSATLADGEKAVVSIPVPTEWKAEEDRLVGISVEDGVVKEIKGTLVDGVYSFEVDHFSAKGIALAAEEVTVEGNPYEGLEDATTYPEYPNDGAVRIDKTATEQNFANTGVVKVELDVAGISVKKGVDVILVADISNSMAWKAGEKNTAPGTGETTKWQDLQAGAGTFIDILLKESSDGTATANTVSFVTFGGFDAQRNSNSNNYSDYFDSVKTVFTSYSNAEDAKAQINAYSITGTDKPGYTVKINGVSAGTPQGGTNYDYAFLETAVAIEQLKSEYLEKNGVHYDNSGREIYVVFMTDGAPDHYNQLYYKSRSTSKFDYYALYKNSDDILKTNYFTNSNQIPTYNDFVQHTENGYYMPSSGDVSNNNWIEWIQEDSLYAAKQVIGIAGVHSITSIGFDLAHGAFGDYSFTEEILKNVLVNLAGENSCEVFITSKSSELNAFYESLATNIRYAGTNANVTDTIKSDFTLHMTDFVINKSEVSPTIDIIAYDLWTKSETSNKDLIGTRKTNEDGSYVCELLETVSFKDGGAYSTAVENGTTNIMEILQEDGTVIIDGEYFTYTKTPDGMEIFVWKLGDITEKEVALSYYAYLKGTLEGTRKEGLYYTNESATIEYVDINSKHAIKEFPKPAVNWGGASTAYEFYLVNANGDPVDRGGNVIPFANRIIVYGPEYQSINLNVDLTVEATIKAKDVLPAGYFLYDENAYYIVKTRSGNELVGDLIISEPSSDAGKDGQDGSAQTTIKVSFDANNYTQSRVAFGVRWDLTAEYVSSELEKDRVVIDYGKIIYIDVVENDKAPTKTNDDGDIVNDYSTYDRELVGFVTYNPNADPTQVQKDPGTDAISYKSDNGIYSIIETTKNNETYQLVSFQLTKMLSNVDKVFCVVKYSKNNDIIYLYEELDIIPATAVYYEDDFGTITYKDATVYPWTPVVGTGKDNLQDDGTVGTGKVPYGYDSSYAGDTNYSNGSAMYINVATEDGNTVDTKTEGGYGITYATFTFTGTGFDVISTTGVNCGLIKAEIYQGTTAGGTIYKYASVANVGASELYQIPVLSCEGMPYGTYTVEIHVYSAYKNTDYPSLNRGGEFVLDAIRIYDPIDVSGTNLKGDAFVAQNAYLADGEAFEEHFEIRDAIVSASDFDGITAGAEGDGVVYIDATPLYDGVNNPNTTKKPEATVQDYTVAGPNNETYLLSMNYKSKPESGEESTTVALIGFILNTTSIPKSIQVGAKSILGTEVLLNVRLENPNPEDSDFIAIMEETLSHATAQNYSTFVDFDNFSNDNAEAIVDFSPYFAKMKDENGNVYYQTYVYISNMCEDVSNILSITDFKATFAEASDMYVTYNSELVASYSLRKTAVEEEPEVATTTLISAAFTTETIRYTKQAYLVVETTSDIENIVLLNENGKKKGKKTSAKTSVTINEEGNKVWTLKFKVGNIGKHTFTVYGTDANGTETEHATVSIEATRR